MLAHAFNICRLDQCNSLLYTLPESQIQKLQRIQNFAARLLTLSPKYNHCDITPILRELHWLPVKYRIIYKTLLLAYKCIHGMDQFIFKNFSKNINLVGISVLPRNFALLLLSHQHNMVSDLSLPASELRNDLPLHVKNPRTLVKLKSFLKTHLFTLAFSFLCFFPCIRLYILFCSCV